VQRSFAIGDYAFGVRSNEPAIGEWLDVLSAYEIPVDEADPYYSLWIGQDSGNTRGFHIFYREAQVTMRTHDLAALAHVFFSELETMLVAHDDDALHLKLGMIGRSGRSALVPYTVVPFLRDRGRAVERELELPLDAYVSVDLETARISRPRRRLELPADAVDWLVSLAPERAGTHPVPLHRDRPDIAVAWNEGNVPFEFVSRAQISYALLQSAANLDRVGLRGIDAVVRLLDGIDAYLLAPAPAKVLVPILRRLLDGDGSANGARVG
jgi:hypothetical protein